MTAEPLYQLEVTATKTLNETIAHLLENTWPEPTAVSFFVDENNIWLTTAHYTEQPDTEHLAAIIRETLELQTGDFSLNLTRVKTIDWVAHVQKNLAPVVAGRFFIHGNHDRELAETKSNTIEIDAAQAFGTAHHGTTRGCLEEISELADTLQPRSILDLGTGTGILAIAARMCWPTAKLIATDIDPIAVRTAVENITHNNAEANIDTICADGLANTDIASCAPFDLIIANILAKPLIGFAPAITAALSGQGTLILSGLLSDQYQAIKNAYQSAGLIASGKKEIDGWVTCRFTAG